MSKPFLLPCLLLTLVLIPIGCGHSKGPETVVLKGKVTFDGALLKEGAIAFLPIDGKGVPSGTTITNGIYRAEIPRGEKRVEIRSRKLVGQKVAYKGDPKSPMIDLFEELIPSIYNSKSNLVMVVKSANNQANFSLESPKE